MPNNKRLTLGKSEMTFFLYSPLEAKLKKRIRSPFLNSEQKKLIIHCCYHKVGTAWFIRILKAISRYYGLSYQDCQQDYLRGDTDIFLEKMSRISIDKLPYHVGSHMIRDPRDIVISGYFYHLWTKEPWAHVPRANLDGKTYQEYLRSLNQDDGLIAEMHGTSLEVIQAMGQWDYDNPNFMEIKYEDIIFDERKVFYKLFKHYGFSENEIVRCEAISQKFSFKNKAKREVGQVKNNKHIRSGRPGQWRDIFTEKHKDCFKDLHGDILIKIGYESNNDW